MRFWVCIFVLLFVHNQFSRADKIINNDSLYTEKYIRDIYISNPKRALQLLDEAETRKAFPLRLINELRSLSYRNMYMNKLAFMYARKSYLLDSISQREPKHMLKMTVYLAELSSIMSKYNESMHYALSGIMQAQKLKDREAEARLLFCIGENNWRLSLKDEAYNYFGRTIELLRGSKDMREMMLLSYYYGAEMGFLMTDSRIDEALALAYEREKLLKKLEKVPEVPEGYIDGQYSYLYAKLAYISYLEKKYAQAEGYYQKYLAIKESHTPDGKMYSIPYLILSKQYETVIDNCKDFKELLRTQRDTLNAQYLTILNKEVQAYLGLNRYKEAAEIRETIIAITDSINSTDRKNAALELNIIYKTSQKEAQIAKHISQLKIRTILLVSLTSISILLLLLLWRIWKYNRTIKYKNATLLQYINEELSNQNKLQETYKSLHLLNEKEETIYPQNDSNTHNEEQEQIENKAIFEKLNFTITQDKLYLSSDLSREELAKKVHLNNTRFARMIKENTGTNLNGYLNNLRLKYAIQLLKEQPNYTLKAIAEESGINSMPTFHNLFKVKTGMTPSEFKNALKSKKVD